MRIRPSGAWMSLSIAAHELIYVADHHGARGRLHHLAFWVDTREECLRAADVFVDSGVPIEAAPSKQLSWKRTLTRAIDRSSHIVCRRARRKRGSST